MKYRAHRIEQDPLNYFLQHDNGGPFLQVADVMLRKNKDPKEVFAHLIRMATDSEWSHSAILYLISDPHQGFNNTFLVEAKTKGIQLASWRNEVIPFDQFTVGIKRPCLDWYMENPYEQSRHSPHDPEDTHGIGYLRHVRGVAIDQINGLYDHKTVYELAALYAERVAKRHLSAVPAIATAAASIANIFKSWDEKDVSAEQVLRFICSGLVQYSFFEALRRRIMNDLAIPEHREAGLSNLSNLHRVIYREDLEGIISRYIEQLQKQVIDIHDPVPDDVLDLLKTATPADFNNSPYLEWRYVVLKGSVWRIERATVDHTPTDKDEAEVLKMVTSEHHP
ncbi:hypothetical protein KDA_19470 [Dictyobacter alpinus]|uniref:Uncharacterized protein n=1 Tax=Dictyobacter alpinus TaxID=2014873 RepID=A0A402B541_9CHLR|nr:hypothetical protein [Dictyobacter alpinus]GCE26463.1 hypothetical protein KDA_19470 [Dictyobacter alpinus]